MRRQYIICLVFSIIFSSCIAGTTPTSLPLPSATAASLPTDTGQPILPPATATASLVAPTSTLPPTFDEPVSFYRLRIELTTSSDWTTLELLNTENVLTVRQLNTVWAPDDATAEFSMLRLGQSLSTAQASNRIGMTVDYAVATEALDQPLNFLLQKGALNGSTVRIYNLIGETTSLLLEVDHQLNIASNPDTNPLSFSLDLSRLRAVPPIQSVCGCTDVPPMVWAFYYPWYSLDDWESDQLGDRPAERYASSDAQAIARHIEQAQAAGIDGFITSWWGPGTETDRNLATLLDLAEERDFKVAIYFETLNNGIGRDENEIFAWVMYVIRTYGSHPAYMQVDGTPVIVLWATGAVIPVHWTIVSNALYLQGLEATLIGMGYSSANLELFDGYHDYGVFAYPDLFQTNAQAARMARYFTLLMDNPESKIFAATVQPGYDDHLLPDRGGGQVQARLDGDFYRNTWDAALASDPDWIFITSWNEWWENTQIEPGESYGDLYLQITREYVDRWKGQ
jgi:hypothetical protein